MEDYLQEPIPAINIDILNWWLERATKFPRLSMLARFIFAIPASSAAPERNFSNAAHFVSERRCQLSTTTVENILICHGNMDIVENNL